MPLHLWHHLDFLSWTGESHRKKVMIATGTGIAPFRSMLFDYLGNGGTDDITLYWGLRHEEAVYWLDELTDLSLKYRIFDLY